MRAKVLDFLEFIITETGMHSDPKPLADQICAEAVKLRDALEAEPHATLRGDPASPGTPRGS